MTDAERLAGFEEAFDALRERVAAVATELTRLAEAAQALHWASTEPGATVRLRTKRHTSVGQAEPAAPKAHAGEHPTDERAGVTKEVANVSVRNAAPPEVKDGVRPAASPDHRPPRQPAQSAAPQATTAPATTALVASLAAPIAPAPATARHGGGWIPPSAARMRAAEDPPTWTLARRELGAAMAARGETDAAIFDALRRVPGGEIRDLGTITRAAERFGWRQAPPKPAPRPMPRPAQIWARNPSDAERNETDAALSLAATKADPLPASLDTILAWGRVNHIATDGLLTDDAVRRINRARLAMRLPPFKLSATVFGRADRDLPAPSVIGAIA